MNLDIIKDILTRKASAYIIIIFGSAAAGRIRVDSDIDIAFLSDNSFSEYEVFCISQELSNALDKDVDLIDITKSSTVFKAIILGTGEIIYCTDEKRKHEFQIRTFKEYSLLNEERKGIMDKIRERGAIYAK